MSKIFNLITGLHSNFLGRGFGLNFLVCMHDPCVKIYKCWGPNLDIGCQGVSGASYIEPCLLCNTFGEMNT